jgi:hypothetical protein
MDLAVEKYFMALVWRSATTLSTSSLRWGTGSGRDTCIGTIDIARGGGGLGSITRKLCAFFRATFFVFQRRFIKKNPTADPRRTRTRIPAMTPAAVAPDDADAAAAAAMASPGVAVEDAVWDSVRLDDPDLVLVRVCVGT